MNKQNTGKPPKNTPGYAFNRIREDALTNLQHDLVSHESTGVSEEHCSAVKLFLQRYIDYASEIPPAHVLQRPLHTILEQYSSLYDQWNEIKGTNCEDLVRGRRTLLTKLRKTRNKFAAASRKNMHNIAENNDLRLQTEIYDALGAIVRAGPDIFSNLAKALDRFSARALPLQNEEQQA